MTTPFLATSLLIVGLIVLRLPFIFQLELSTDEAHYALYGAFLDWSYYDHPPMVGWLMASSQMLWGYSDAALRILPLVFSSLTLLLVYHWARLIYPKDSGWLGFRAVLLISVSPLPFITGMAMIPETPLNLFGMGALIVMTRILTNAKHIWRWVGLGVLLGLCGLSKYTAILIPIVLMLTLILYGRPIYQIIWQQGKWGIFLAFLLALLSILPVVVWNYSNDWVSLNYQWGHVTNQAQSAQTWSITNFLKSIVGQWVGYLPLFSGALFVISRLMKSTNVHLNIRSTVTNHDILSQQVSHLPEKMAALLWFVWILMVIGFSGFKVALPHWSELAWMASAPLIAYHWQYRSTCLLKSGRFFRLKLYYQTYRTSAIVSVCLLLIVFGSVFYYPSFFTLTPKHVAEVRGWSSAAQHANQLRMEHFPEHPQAKIWVQNWVLGSRIAWPLQRERLKQGGEDSRDPKYNPLQVLDQRFDQFDLWFDAPLTLDHFEQNGRSSARGILVEWSVLRKKDLEHYVQAWGMQCTLIDQQDVFHEERVIAWFRFWQCLPSHVY